MRLLSGALKRAEDSLTNHHDAETIGSGKLGDSAGWKERQKKRWENNGVAGEGEPSKDSDKVEEDKKRKNDDSEFGSGNKKKAKWTEEFMADMLSESDEEET